MTITTQKSGPVWTITHSRPEARRALGGATGGGLTLGKIARRQKLYAHVMHTLLHRVLHTVGTAVFSRFGKS